MRAIYRPGATLTGKQREDVRRLAREQVAEAIDAGAREQAKAIIAAILVTLSEEFGFGHDRLLRVFNRSNELVEAFAEHYATEGDDTVYILKRRLEDKGIDLDALMK